MNSHGLNVATINSSAIDVTQRAVIICIAITRVMANAVVRRRAKFNATAEACTSGVVELITRETVPGCGVIARVRRRLAQDYTHEVAITVVPRIMARMILVVAATADLVVKSKVYKRSIQAVTNTATIVLTSYVWIRNTTNQVATAIPTILARIFKRNTASVIAEAKLSIFSRVFPRVFHSSIELIYATADVSTAYLKIFTRSAVTVTSEVVGLAVARVFRRAIIIQSAETWAIQNASIYKQVFYEFPAEKSKVFLVPKGSHLFYVR